MKTVKLTSSQLYWLNELKKMKIKICRLGINRNLNDKEVEKKVKSFALVKKVLVPGLLVECKKCLAEGLEAFREDGTSVKSDDPDLEVRYVLIDGAHRNAAVQKYNEQLLKTYQTKSAFQTSSVRREPLKKEYENSIIDMEFQILETDKKLAEVHKEVNVAVYLWKGGDYLTQILAYEDTDKEYIDYTSLK